ncbi:MAG: extracellular solute-binding protein [Acidimicrobiia bacterium]|nr:extracellular solute-binding protein [Acidimicrobiia bacterium]MDH5420891.1 extracellular solute-binding protein [Acidimicrobiia bacterium]
MRALTILLVLSLLGAACSADRSGDPLVVYSGRSEDLVGPLFEQFAAESGIEIDVRYGDSTELAATLILEGATSNAQVFFAQDPASIGSVANAGLLQPLEPELAGLVDPRFSDREGRWVGVSARARTVVYNPELITGPLPESVWELTDPEYAGLGIAPTNGSFLAFVAAMIMLDGEDQTRAWLEAIAANNPTPFPKNSPIVAAADAGEIGFGLVNHYYLLQLQAEQGTTTAKNHFLTAGDAGSLVMPAGIGILNSAGDRTADATALIEFLLSESAQSYFATQTFEYPVAAGVAAFEGLKPLDELSSPDLDLTRLSEFLDRATELVTEAGLV